MTVDQKLKKNRSLFLHATSPEAYSEDGIDLTMIHWMLGLTPAERLEVLQRYVRSVEQLRNAESST